MLLTNFIKIKHIKYVVSKLKINLNVHKNMIMIEVSKLQCIETLFIILNYVLVL